MDDGAEPQASGGGGERGGVTGKTKQTEPIHCCHAYACPVVVPAKMLMCLKHWRMVPQSTQRLVWKHYRPGQEVDKRPSKEYLEVTALAIRQVREKEQKIAAMRTA